MLSYIIEGHIVLRMHPMTSPASLTDVKYRMEEAKFNGYVR